MEVGKYFFPWTKSHCFSNVNLSMKYFSLVVIGVGLFSNQIFGYERKYIEVCRGIAFEADYWGVWRESLKKTSVFFWTDGNGDILGPIYEKATYKDGTELSEMKKFRNISMGYVSGLRASIRLSPDSAQSAEVAYEGLLRWKKDKSVFNAKSALAVPTHPYVTHDWIGFMTGSYHYQSHFDSGEVSYWYHMTRQRINYFSLSWMGGLRIVNFYDRLNINNIHYTSIYKIKIKNLPLGLQAGIDFQNNPWGRFSWMVRFKGGIYANLIDKSVFLTDFSNTSIVIDEYFTKTQLTYLIELTPAIVYRLKPLYLIVAYDFLGMYNVAFAPSQIKETHSIKKIFAKKDLLLNSFQAGIGFNF